MAHGGVRHSDKPLEECRSVVPQENTTLYFSIVICRSVVLRMFPTIRQMYRKMAHGGIEESATIYFIVVLAEWRNYAKVMGRAANRLNLFLLLRRRSAGLIRQCRVLLQEFSDFSELVREFAIRSDLLFV